MRPEIMYLSKPHIGTYHLNETVEEIRNKIIRLGGEVRFDATATEILRKDGLDRGVGFGRGTACFTPAGRAQNTLAESFRQRLTECFVPSRYSRIYKINIK